MLLSSAGQRSSLFLQLRTDPGPDWSMKTKIYYVSVALCSAGLGWFRRRFLFMFKPKASQGRSIKYKLALSLFFLPPSGSDASRSTRPNRLRASSRRADPTRDLLPPVPQHARSPECVPGRLSGSDQQVFWGRGEFPCKQNKEKEKKTSKDIKK